MRAKILFAAIITAAISHGAETVYVRAWSQDFEDSATYAAQMAYRTTANRIFGTSDAVLDKTAYCEISNAERILYGTETTSRYYRLFKWQDAENGYYHGPDPNCYAVLFQLPQGIANAAGYRVEFDYYLSQVIASDFAGLAINGGRGVLATLHGWAGDKTKESSGTLYRGDDFNAPLATLKSWRRSENPSNAAVAKYWMHITVTGSANGVHLNIVRADGTPVYDGAISETYDTVDSLFLYINRGRLVWNAYTDLDDVAVSLPDNGSNDFVWTGASGDGLWGTPGNWSFAGLPSLVAPGANDSAVFPHEGSPWHVALASDAAANVSFYGATALTGGKTLSFASLGGYGAVTLSNANLHAVNSLTIANEIIAAPNTENRIIAEQGGSVITLAGSLSGSGRIICQPSGEKNWGGVHFTGQNPFFTGELVLFKNSNPRADHEIYNPDALNSSMALTIDYMSGNGNHNIFPFYGNGTWEIGALNGEISNYSENIKNRNFTLFEQHYVIGERNEDCELTGYWDSVRAATPAKWFASIDWVAPSATLRYGVAETLKLTVSGGGTLALTDQAAFPSGGISFTRNGGTLEISARTETGAFADPSSLIVDSDAPIGFACASGQIHTWASPLAASNTRGFAKRGGGTLVMSSPPAHAGLTTVEDGALIISNATLFAAGPRTKSTVDAFGTAFLEPSGDTAPVAMAGLATYDNLSDAVAVCINNQFVVLTILADLDAPVEIPFGKTLLVRPMGHEFSFSTAEHCRIETSAPDANGIIVCTSVRDVVTVAPPDIPNAYWTATANGETLRVSSDGLFHVLRGEVISFRWFAYVGYTLTFDCFDLAADADANAIRAERLPFSMKNADLASGAILRLQGGGGIVTPPDELKTISVESISPFALQLAGALCLSNFVFIADATLAIIPPPGFADGDTLIAWQTQTPVDAFSLAPAFDSDWMLRSESDGLKIYRRSLCSLNGRTVASIEDAFVAANDGDILRLDGDSWVFERVDLPPGTTLSLDLNGYRLKSRPLWLFNVGDASLHVANGAIDCSSYGFYICDGELTLENCDIAANGRVVQIRGAGTVDIAESARLETAGNDPVVFAVGDYDGKASVNCRGALVQNFAHDGETTAYCVAGNPADTFGANFALCGDSGKYFAAATDSCIHHPEEQGGEVTINGGWFSIDPKEWLVKPWGVKGENLDGYDGWRVVRLKGFVLIIR